MAILSATSASLCIMVRDIHIGASNDKIKAQAQGKKNEHPECLQLSLRLNGPAWIAREETMFSF